MRVLILGGTSFVGRAVAEAASANGHEVTLLNRGSSPPPAEVTSLTGDRSSPGGLDALAGREWDVVVDTWSWAPSAVSDSARLLSDRADRYVYISSRSVYRDPVPAGADEHAPTVDGSPDEADADDYARAKRGAELAVLDAFGDRALLARAGLILGPHEDIGRLPWWLSRVAQGGQVLAPGPADLPLQYVDARNLAAFVLSDAALSAAGAVNVVSEPGHGTMRALLGACVAATGSDARLVWTDPAAILDGGIAPWTDLPIWIPPGEDHDMMHRGDVSTAMALGLRCRPIEDTVDDTWTWLRSVGGVAPQRADRPTVGLDPERERRILGA